MSDAPTTSSSAPVAWDPDTDLSNYKWKAFAAIGVSFVTMVMSMSMVFVALSAIAADFGVSLRVVSWVVIAQALTISAIMLPMGRVADIIGRKRIHLIGLALFGGGALFAAASPTLGILIFARVIMAVGNAMSQSVGTAMVVSVFPASERGKAIGSQTTAVALGGAMGPVIAGLMLQWFPWQALFIMISIPIAIAFVIGLVVLDEDRVSQRIQGQRPAYDWLGAFLSAAAVVVLVLTINNPLGAGWLSPLIIGGFIGFILLMAGFIKWELGNPSPMLDLRMFQNTVFSMAVTTRLIGFMGTTATRFMMPIYLISLRGLGEGAAGGMLFLSAMGMGIAAQSGGRLADRFGARPFTIIGFVVLFATVGVFAFMDSETPFWFVMSALFVNGLAMGMWSVPNNTVILNAVSKAQFGVVGALTNLTRNVGNVIGQAIAAAIVVGVMTSRGFDIPLDQIDTIAGASEAFIDGWKIAYIAVTGFTLVGLFLAIMTRPGKSVEGK